MIRFDTSAPDALTIHIECNGCDARESYSCAPETLFPTAAAWADAYFAERGWTRNVPVPITRPRITKYDKDGRPETAEDEAGTMPGDLCAECLKATEAA